MQNKKEDKECYDECCPYLRPHRHVITNNGCYIDYIVDKPIKRENVYADTWG